MIFSIMQHKIMYRKGHLFVADYRWKTNILNRYQIKYAVREDYLFINQDPNDYRHSYQIINRISRSSETARSKTNISTLQRFISTEIILLENITPRDEAAIAYNKRWIS